MCSFCWEEWWWWFARDCHMCISLHAHARFQTNSGSHVTVYMTPGPVPVHISLKNNPRLSQTTQSPETRRPAEDVDGQDHEPEPADNARPSVSVPGLHGRHQPRPPSRHAPLHRGVHADSRRRSLFPRLWTHADIAVRFLLPSRAPTHYPSSSAPTLFDPTLEFFPLAPGPHPCSPVTSTSLQLP